MELLPTSLAAVNLGSDNGGLIVDLSEYGAGIQAVKALRSDTLTDFSFRLPNTTFDIQGTASLTWVDATGLRGGLHFETLSHPSQEWLQRWLANANSSAESGGAGAPANAAAADADGSPQLPLDFCLKRVVERARAVTRAHGASLVLRRRDGEFVCEASVGIAPAQGRSVDLRRGLSAECILSRSIVHCDNAREDPRIDSSANPHLDLGSAILAPLFQDKRVTGILAVFSRDPHAFTADDTPRLRQLGESFQRAWLDRCREPVPPAPQTPGEATAGYTTDADRRPAPQRLRTRWAVAALGAAGLAAALYLGYWRPTRLNPTNTARATLPEANKLAAQSALPAPAVPEPQPSSYTVAAVSGTPARDSQNSFSRPEQTKPQPSQERKPGAADAEQRARESVRDIIPNRIATALPERQPLAVPVAEPVAPPPDPAAASQVRPRPAPPVAPVIAPAPRRARVEVVTSVVNSRFSEPPVPEAKVEVPYPAIALAAGKQGSVVLKAKLSRQGTLSDLRILDGEELFAGRAMQALSWWRYKPYAPAGRPLEVEIVITVNFTLSP